jgi:hypothetical protein
VAIFDLFRWPNSVVILELFGISFGTVSVAVFALVRHGSVWFDLSSLSGAFAGILDVRYMLGALIVSNHGVRSLALLCFVDSSVGVLAIT